MIQQNVLHDVEGINSSDEGEGDYTASVSADADEPHQSRAKARKSVSEMCQKIEALFTKECHKYPLIRKYLYSIDDSDRKLIMQVAFQKTRECAVPRVAYFLHWLVEEVLQDPNRTLNYSDFARLIGIKRHVVSKQLLPQALQLYAKHINERLFMYLLYEGVSLEVDD
jgi:hypothetical protein